MTDQTQTQGQILIDGRLTLALLVTICLEAVAGLTWIGAAAQRLTVLETTVNVQPPIAERMARIETQMTGMRATLDRIENQMDREHHQ